MQYFAQDEATRLEPTRTVYETLADGSPLHMVPAIRTILGGFLFEGDDVHKKAAVLSGGERTRLAVARMLLRPANTLLLDEPTNHLDLDSKDVLLDALEDFGGTLILVSHDRYFIDRLATKVVEVGHGRGHRLPRRLRSLPVEQGAARTGRERGAAGTQGPLARRTSPSSGAGEGRGRGTRRRGRGQGGRPSRARKRSARKPSSAASGARSTRSGRGIAQVEATIADHEREMKELESAMSAPGFYEDHVAQKPVLDRHQTLMWELGDLMHRWEELSAESEALAARALESPAR